MSVGVGVTGFVRASEDEDKGAGGYEYQFEVRLRRGSALLKGEGCFSNEES